MEAKEILKDKGITLSKFAEDFKLSRNTAMLYIEKYDNGEEIPKEKYKIVFNSLFGSKNLENFDYNYFTAKELIQRDVYTGAIDLSPERTDLVMDIFENLINFSKSGKIDDKLLYFIRMCLHNYMNEVVFKTLANYFYFFNNSSETDYQQLTEEEKKIYTNYFKVFIMQKHECLTLDKNIENMFLARIKEINYLKTNQ